jgi:hypothetical protein
MLQNWLDQNRSELELGETIAQAAEDWKNHLDKPDKDTYLIHQGRAIRKCRNAIETT